MSRSTAAAIASGVPGAKVDTHSPSNAFDGADEHAARGGVDDADADVGADAVPVAVVTGDDLHIGAVGRVGRLHHVPRCRRDAQELDDVGERGTVAQLLVGACAPVRAGMVNSSNAQATARTGLRSGPAPAPAGGRCPVAVNVTRPPLRSATTVLVAAPRRRKPRNTSPRAG